MKHTCLLLLLVVQIIAQNATLVNFQSCENTDCVYYTTVSGTLQPGQWNYFEIDITNFTFSDPAGLIVVPTIESDQGAFVLFINPGSLPTPDSFVFADDYECDTFDGSNCTAGDLSDGDL
jgi:hypothetical protein